MQQHEQGTGHSARGQAEVGEPLTVDGRPATEASKLAPEAYDLTDYKPIHEPVTLYRRFGGEAAPPAADDDGAPPGTVDEKSTFSETLRRQLANKGHPAKAVLDVRCGGRGRHRLLWLVPSPWGLVPITHTADEPDGTDAGPVLSWLPQLGGEPVRRKTVHPEARRFTSHFHGEDLEPGRPQTLGEWPEDRPLPPASCPCYAEVVLTVAQVRTCLASARRTTRAQSGRYVSARPDATYRPPRSIV